MLPPPAVPRETAPAATPETIEVQVPPGAPPAESIEMQEELRADTRAAETGPTAAERWALPHWAEYIQQNNNDESSDDDSSYVPDYNSDGETVIETSDSDSNIEMQEELGADTAVPECECTAECACGHATLYTILFWLAGTVMTFVAGFEFTYTFEAAFNIHHLLSDKAFSTSAIICFVCLLLSVILCFSLPCVQGPRHKKCGFSSTSKCFSPFLSLIAILYCVSFGLAVHARNGLDDTVEDYCDLWDDEEEETGGGWYYYSFDCDKDVKEHLLHYLNVLLCCTAINAALTAAVACICWLDPGGVLSDKPVPSDGPSDAVVDVESVESGAGTRTSIEGEETVLDGEVVTSPASSENVVDAEPVSPSISFWAAGLVAAAGERARRALSPREPEAQEGAESPVPPPPPTGDGKTDTP